MDPRTFIDEYVNSAIVAWRADEESKHLAVHALAQVDNLAEVVFKHLQKSGQAPHKRVREFRDDLTNREPALGIARDAHDSHKHGVLNRPTATSISKGQRPQVLAGTAIFADYSFVGDFLGDTVMSVILNDGTELSVSSVLDDAMKAWNRELKRLGL